MTFTVRYKSNRGINKAVVQGCLGPDDAKQTVCNELSVAPWAILSVVRSD